MKLTEYIVVEKHRVQELEAEVRELASRGMVLHGPMVPLVTLQQPICIRYIQVMIKLHVDPHSSNFGPR